MNNDEDTKKPKIFEAQIFLVTTITWIGIKQICLNASWSVRNGQSMLEVKEQLIQTIRFIMHPDNAVDNQRMI